MKQTDAELVKEVLEGNMDSFGILVRRYQGAVYGLAYHIVGNFADAEDLAQEAFLQAYLKLRQLREPSKFAGWLRQITQNVCNMWLRSQRIGYVSLDAGEEDSDATLVPAQSKSDPALEAERRELRDAVLKAMNSLSEKNRLTVTLFYMDGLSYRQISDFLEVPVTTVESRLYKARRQLKGRMIRMIEQDFSEKEPRPEFSYEIVEGTLRIEPPSGIGRIPQGDDRKDILLPPRLIREYQLRNGDTVKGKARKGGMATVRQDGTRTIRDTIFEVEVVNNEEAVRHEINVEGVLEIIPDPSHETEYGFLRQGKNLGMRKPLETDVYVSPSQIKRFGLKTGDVVEGITFPPKPDFVESHYVLVRIDRVNGEDLRG